MLQLLDAVKVLQRKGYTENLVAHFDHLTCGEVKLLPPEIYFDHILRFENASDPDDQAILYAISSPSKKIKGIYIESYGLYHDEWAPELLQRLKFCRSIKREIDRLPHT